MDKLKALALAVYESPKVRIAAKALGVAVAAVLAERLGLVGFLGL